MNYLDPDSPVSWVAAKKIIIYTTDKSSIVTVLSLDQSGNYRISLPTGQYVVDINRIGIDSSADVPITITVESGKTTWLDVRIDTGIRQLSDIKPRKDDL